MTALGHSNGRGALETTMSARHLPSLPPPPPLEPGEHPTPPESERSETRPRRRLSVLGLEAVGSLERHPRDGWRRARLFPMGRGARRALKGLIRTLCPTSVDAPLGPQVEHHVEVYVRFFMCYMPRWMARGIWLALFLLEWAPFWVGHGLRRLSSLPPRRRARVIARLGRSRLFVVRRLVMVLNSLFMSAYFDSERVHRALGYAPVPFMRERIEVRRRLLTVPTTIEGATCT